MPDREKVVSALHCRAQDLMTDLPACDGCDYQVQLVNHGGCDFRKLCRDAIELLKEQDDLGTELTNAVELIHKKNERIEKLLKEQGSIEPVLDEKTKRFYRCGACGEYVGFIDSDPGDPNEQDNYCRNCGRAVKWD